MKAPALLRALRPLQWSKNLFVLAAIGFAAGDHTVRQPDGADLVRVLVALVAFCLASSAVYLVNDILDVERDRLHPEKRKRPIAAGELGVGAALTLCGLCAATSLALGLVAGAGGPAVTGVLVGYMVLQGAYSLKLKHVVLVDAFCIAGGFLLRVEAGGLAAQAEISHWLLLCTLFLALFLALNKRQAEIAMLGSEKGNHRAILDEYTPGFLNQMVTVLAACTIVNYTMYTVDARNQAKFGDASGLMIWTVPFVVFGIGRYMYLVQSGKGGSNPTRVLMGGDLPFLINLVGWVAMCGVVVLRG